MRRKVTGRALLAGLAALALIAAGCGDDDDSSADATTTTEAPTDETTATTEPKEEGFVSSLQIQPGDGADEVIIRDDPIDDADPEDAPDDTDDLDNFDSYTDYQLVTDSTGTLQLEIPVEWDSYDLDGFVDDTGTTSGIGVGGSPDEAAFDTTWSVPGVRFLAQPYSETTYPEYLEAASYPSACTDGGTSDYDDGLYTGQAQVWEDCGGIGTTYVVIAASDADNTVDVVVSIQIVTEADLEAAEQIVNTFQVVGPV
jgi:hypothetical protein